MEYHLKLDLISKSLDNLTSLFFVNENVKYTFDGDEHLKKKEYPNPAFDTPICRSRGQLLPSCINSENAHKKKTPVHLDCVF